MVNLEYKLIVMQPEPAIAEPNALFYLQFFGIMFLYLLPVMIGMFKNKKTLLHIIVLNIFVGWTFIGWVLAFALCFLDDGRYT